MVNVYICVAISLWTKSVIVNVGFIFVAISLEKKSVMVNVYIFVAIFLFKKKSFDLSSVKKVYTGTMHIYTGTLHIYSEDVSPRSSWYTILFLIIAPNIIILPTPPHSAMLLFVILDC